MSDVTTVGIDLAKNVFSLHGVDAEGAVVLRRSVNRAKLLELVAQLPPCLIGMEACSGAHEWARRFSRFGHTGAADGTEVRRALSQERQERRQRRRGDLRGGRSPQHALRAGEERSSSRPTCACTVRDRGSSRSARRRSTACGDCSPSSVTCSRSVPSRCAARCRRCSSNYRAGQRAASAISSSTCASSRRRSRPTNARSKRMRGTVPSPSALKHARASARSPPRPSSLPSAMRRNSRTADSSPPGSGSCRGSTRPAARQRLGHITRRGDGYLRMLLVMGARSVLQRASRDRDPLSRWALAVRERRGYHRACVAIAAKNARVLWAVLAKAPA